MRHVCIRMLFACARILKVCIRVQMSCACMLHVCACIFVPRNPNPTLSTSLSFISLISYASTLFVFVFVSVCFSMALLALCYIGFLRPKVSRLGDKEGVLVRSHVLRLKLEMTRNISKSLDILTMCQNELHLSLSRFW